MPYTANQMNTSNYCSKWRGRSLQMLWYLLWIQVQLSCKQSRHSIWEAVQGYFTMSVIPDRFVSLEWLNFFGMINLKGLCEVNINKKKSISTEILRHSQNHFILRRLSCVPLSLQLPIFSTFVLPDFLLGLCSWVTLDTFFSIKNTQTSVVKSQHRAGNFNCIST